MDGYTYVDGIVLALIVLSALLAYSRGLVRELMSIAGWVIAGILGFMFAPVAEPLVREIPVLKDLIGTSCDLSILAAFAAVFAVSLVVVSLFTPLLAGFVQNSAVGPIDQGLGLLFGVARGVVLVVIALVVYDRIMGEGGGVPVVDDSRSREIFAGIQEQMTGWLPEDAPQWIAGQYQTLTDGCN